MSYCRTTSDNDLYIIASIHHQSGNNCYICYHPIYLQEECGTSSFLCFTKKEIVDHIKWHINVGHKVYSYVIPNILKDDWTE